MEFLGNRGKDNYLPHAFGHEASGKVIGVGNKVKKVSIKDEVILSWIKGKGLDYGGFKLANVKNKKINKLKLKDTIHHDIPGTWFKGPF